MTGFRHGTQMVTSIIQVDLRHASVLVHKGLGLHNTGRSQTMTRFRPGAQRVRPT